MLKPKTKTKTRWTREFKLRALARMDEAADITALAKELGVQRELLYIWRRNLWVNMLAHFVVDGVAFLLA